MFELRFTPTAHETYRQLEANRSQAKRYKAVKKALKFLANDPRHNSLQTHEFTSLKGPNGEKVYTAYAEQSTPAAYRIFFYYGPAREIITILAITPHP